MDNEIWDAVVVGAGPAGAVSAYLLARRGWRVLLLEKSRWPREKVCGGCVNAAAVRMLRGIGLEEVLRGGERLDRFRLQVGGKELLMELPEGMAVSRAVLDERLVAAAVAEGAYFVPGVSAKLSPNSEEEFRHIRVMNNGNEIVVRSRVVLACDGIGGTLLESEPWAAWRVARDAWFGVSAMADAALVEAGTIGMHVGQGGYAGVARLSDGRTHVAAALDPTACREAGGPAEIVGRIVQASFGDARFQGTGLLTRKRMKLGGYRVLAVGDACGYVEPFTGEGIAWAVRGAREVVSFLPEHAAEWSKGMVAEWERRHRAAIGTSWCHLLRRVVRRPRLAGMAVEVANLIPAVAGAIGRRVGRQRFGPDFSRPRWVEGVDE